MTTMQKTIKRACFDNFYTKVEQSVKSHASYPQQFSLRTYENRELREMQPSQQYCSTLKQISNDILVRVRHLEM